MRPSERRALEAEKRAREAAEWHEKELRRQAELAEKKARREARKASAASSRSPVSKETFDPNKYDFEEGKKRVEPDSERINTNASYQKLPEGEIEVKGDGYHREGFFSRHVRLIGLIVGLTLAITVICPLGLDIYFTIKERQEIGTEVEGDRLITVEEIIKIAESKDPFTWDKLGKLEYRSFGDDVREYSISGTEMVLRIEMGKESKYPTVVRVIHYTKGVFFSEVRGADIDKLETFFAENGYSFENEESTAK